MTDTLDAIRARDAEFTIGPGDIPYHAYHQSVERLSGLTDTRQLRARLRASTPRTSRS